MYLKASVPGNRNTSWLATLSSYNKYLRTTWFLRAKSDRLIELHQWNMDPRKWGYLFSVYLNLDNKICGTWPIDQHKTWATKMFTLNDHSSCGTKQTATTYHRAKFCVGWVGSSQQIFLVTYIPTIHSGGFHLHFFSVKNPTNDDLNFWACLFTSKLC